MDWQERDKLVDYCEKKAQGAGEKDPWGLTPKITSLCGSCHGSQIVRRKSSNDVVILCHTMGDELGAPIRIPDDITQCSRYSDANAVSLRTMVDLATLIDINEDGVIGFKVIIPEDPTKEKK